MRGPDVAIGSAIVLGNAQRGEMILTPNENGTIEVAATGIDGEETVVTIARSEVRRLFVFLKTELRS